MNILYGRTDINMAGPGVVMLKTALAMQQFGHNITVASSGGELQDSFQDHGIDSYVIEELSIGRRDPFSILKAIIKLRKIIKDKNIKVIHGHNLVTTLLMYLAAISCGKKVKTFTTVHGVGKEVFFKYAPGKLVAVSKYVKNRLISVGIPHKKVEVIYNGFIDLNTFPVSPNYYGKNSGECINIINVAMMTGGKGHERVIEAFSSVCKDFPKITLTLVGDGICKKQLIQYCEQLGIQEKVKFVGVSYEVKRLLSESDIFVHLPNSETFGMVVLEAMAAGLGVLTCNVGGIPELIDSGENGIIVDHDFTKISSNLRLLVKDKSLRNSLGKNARAKVAQNFSSDEVFAQYNMLYSEKK